MSYLGWLKLPHRVRVLRGKLPLVELRTAKTGAGAPLLRFVGPRRQRRGHSPWIFTVGSRAGRAGRELRFSLGFRVRMEEKAGAKGRAGWAKNERLGLVVGVGSALMRREVAGAAPFPVHP